MCIQPSQSARFAWIIVPTVLLLFLSLPASATTYQVKLEFDVKIPMRDGVNLSADIFRPDAAGRFPVILVRTPYDNGTAAEKVRGKFWASRGFVYVTQDVRGRGDSDGVFYPLINEAGDGYDTQTWCGTQPWSNGKVGMTGGSYLGWVQVYSAGLRNPNLAALVSIVTPPDPNRNCPVQFGVYNPTMVSWLAFVSGKTLQDISQLDLMAAYQGLPLYDMDTRLGRTIQAWRDWLDHPALDDYWRKQAYQEKLLEENVPILHITGWYDDVQVGTTENFVNLTTRAKDPLIRKGQRLIIGPWGHAVNTKTKLGDIDFGPQALIELDAIQLRWFDRWLRGVENGVMEEPPVKIFVMGENKWRDEQEWPMARTQYVKSYLHSHGRANSLLGDGTLTPEAPLTEPTDQYSYDPADPVPFITDPGFSQVGGPDDYRAVERRDDVLVYTTPALTEELEVCGPLRLKLYASSSAKDTDWTAKILDVHPNGFAQRLNDGIVRARFRKSLEREELLNPGEIAEYDIDCWSTCILLGKGHRLRLEVSSSAFPKFDRNLNTGGPIGKETEGVVARQIVYHDRLHPSHVIIPVVPRSKT